MPIEIVIPARYDSSQENTDSQGAFRGPASYHPLKIIEQILTLQFLFYAILFLEFYLVRHIAGLQNTQSIIYVLLSPKAVVAMGTSTANAMVFALYLCCSLLMYVVSVQHGFYSF